jgi:hypothetical protein
MRLRFTVWALAGLLPALMSALSGDALAQRGVASPHPEDNRPPLFFREEWKHPFDSGGPPEGPVGQEHVSNPSLQLRAYGEKPKSDPQPATGEHTHAGIWMNKRFKNDPAHLFTGTCNRPCAVALRHQTNFVNLSGFGSKIRWQVKIAGLHQIRPILKLADGTWLIGDYAEQRTPGFDWRVSEFSIADVPAWFLLDIDKVITIGGNQAGLVMNPDLTHVDEIGFADLMPGSGHGGGIAGGWSDVGWIEVYGQPVSRASQ